jgi:superfamily I DNA/RNA helicase
LTNEVLSNAHRVQILTIGDEMQCIYEFKGASKRFLTMAYAIYPKNKTPSVAVIMHKSLVIFVVV